MSSDNTAAGNIYVFNVYSQSMSLSLNGLGISAGDISGWPSNSDKTPYRPFGAAVPRTLNASDSQGKFFNGSNILSILWLDGLYGASVPMSGPLNQDMLLFIDKDSWRLVNQFGGDGLSGSILPAKALEQLATAAKTSHKH